MLCCVTLFCVVLSRVALWSVVLCCVVLCRVALCCMVFRCVILGCVVPHCVVFAFAFELAFALCCGVFALHCLTVCDAVLCWVVLCRVALCVCIVSCGSCVDTLHDGVLRRFVYSIVFCV